MRSIWLVALSNLRRRKGQGILVGFILGLSVLLFFTGLGVLRTIESPVHLMLERQRASQITLRFDARIYDPDSIRAWWAGRPEVASVTEAMAAIELQKVGFFKRKR